MKHLGIPLATLLLFSTTANSQETDLTDLTRYEIFGEGQETLSLAEIETLEEAYLSLVAAGDCANATPAIVEFHEAANLASNLIRRGNEPYYDARRDDQENVARSPRLLDELVAAERTFNNLIRQRNIAWVEEAKCFLALGQRQEGITRLFRALDYISVDERDLWQEARQLLWAEVGFQP